MRPGCTAPFRISAGADTILAAETPPEAIYAAGDGTFAFRRTVSRLSEMQSADYIANRPRR